MCVFEIPHISYYKGYIRYRYVRVYVRRSLYNVNLHVLHACWHSKHECTAVSYTEICIILT